MLNATMGSISEGKKKWSNVNSQKSEDGLSQGWLIQGTACVKTSMLRVARQDQEKQKVTLMPSWGLF